MLNFKQATLKTLKRNIESGKWQEVRPVDPKTGRAMIRTTSATRGVHNTAGRIYVIEVQGDLTTIAPRDYPYGKEPETLRGNN